MPLIIAHGQPKSGSTFLCETALRARDLIDRTDHFAELRKLFNGNDDNYHDSISAELCRRILKEAGSTTIVLKTHGLPMPGVRALIESGQVRAFTSFRDPRDACRSMLDAGVAARERGEEDFFASLYTIQDCAKFITHQLRTVQKWSDCPNVLTMPYYAIAADQDFAVTALCRHLGFGAIAPLIAAKMRAEKNLIYNFNKGQVDRFLSDFSRDELILLNEAFSRIIDNYEILLESQMAKHGHRLLLQSLKQARMRREAPPHVGAVGPSPVDPKPKKIGRGPLRTTRKNLALSAVNQLFEAQDWEACLEASLHLLESGPGADARVCSRGYYAAAKLGDRTAAAKLLSAVDVAQLKRLGPRSHIAQGACIFGDIETARRALDHPIVLAARDHPQIARLFIATTGKFPHQAIPQADLLKRSGRPKVLIVDPGFSVLAGHHFMCSRVAVEMFQDARFGFAAEDIWLVTGSQGSEDDAQSSCLRNFLRPVFRFRPYGYTDYRPNAELLENLNRAWQTDLAQTFAEVDLSAVRYIFVHSMNLSMMGGFVRWLCKRFAGKPVVAIIGVIEIDFLAGHGDIAEAGAEIYAHALSELANAALPLIVYTETSEGSDFLGKLSSGLRIHTLPYLAASLADVGEGERAAFSQDRITIGLLGGSRPNRGLELFPPLIQRFAGRSEVRWIVQMDRDFLQRSEPEMIGVMEQAVQDGRLEWLQGRLDDDAYFHAFRRLDVVLMPYGERYSVSGSGVVQEAMRMGRYVMAPEGTSMSRALAEHEYPASFLPSLDVESISVAIEQILAGKEGLRNLMAEAVPRSLKRPSSEYLKELALTAASA